MESIKVYENFMTISISKNGIKKKKNRAGEMALKLGALADLEDN